MLYILNYSKLNLDVLLEHERLTTLHKCMHRLNAIIAYEFEAFSKMEPLVHWKFLKHIK